MFFRLGSLGANPNCYFAKAGPLLFTCSLQILLRKVQVINIPIGWFGWPMDTSNSNVHFGQGLAKVSPTSIVYV